jgi:hypothetical protein
MVLMSNLHTEYLNRKQAAAYVGIPESTLRSQMRIGTGPIHFRPSPKVVLFARRDLDAWRSNWKQCGGK